MSVAPHAGIVDFGTFTPPTSSVDGIQGEVPQPLAGQQNYVLTANGWVALSSLGTLVFQGTWDASTNNPTLTSSVGVQGYYYVVSVAGNTDLNGITTWTVGDWAIFSGSVWQKLEGGSTVDITGGNINGTVIGNTNPAAGTFTTITGQTGQLNGTGTNLFTRSQELENAAWANSNASVNSNVALAPDGTNTADKIVENTVASVAHEIRTPTVTLTSGITYTVSVFAKQAERRYLRIGFAGAWGTVNNYAIFDLVDGSNTYKGNANLIASSVNFGNGWYRCIVTYTVLTTSSNTLFVGINIDSTTGTTYTGDGTSGLLAWGAQLELGSTANTYIPTTTTAVYGTPTLSFSGVSSIGLQSNGALYLEPAGNGAIQADATTSTAVGGNARGANAVDWQTSRNAASQVASAELSFVGGGTRNTASSFNSTIVGGATNLAQGNYNFVGGGQSNTANGSFLQTYSAIVGGRANTANGYHNFIGAGFTNSGTSITAVTTQSGTMNGTTAVTLSGSNANIRVGQFITGTSIADQTYVAAISGTSLTLSQNASGSSTSTLSFFTPHGVVVGGGNNQATGSYSFIGGGGDAGTAANRNVASGDWSVAAGGLTNQATGFGSSIIGGNNNIAAGAFNIVAGGQFNRGTSGTASATLTTIFQSPSSWCLYFATNPTTTARALMMITGAGYGFSNGIYAQSTFPTAGAVTASIAPGTAATFTGSISGTTLTVSSVTGTIVAGAVLSGGTVSADTFIVSGSGTTWTVNNTQTATCTTATPIVMTVTGTNPNVYPEPIIGMNIAGIAANTFITGFGTVNPNQTGTYYVNKSQTVSSTFLNTSFGSSFTGTVSGSTLTVTAVASGMLTVGQVVTGSGIAAGTFISALGTGTGGTGTYILNQSTTGTPTATTVYSVVLGTANPTPINEAMSFFSSHGTVMGGLGNRATGSWAAIVGGGGNAGGANGSLASGDLSFIGGGGAHTASGRNSVVCGGGFGNGNGNTASSQASFVGAGYVNTASGFATAVVGGVSNISTANWSFAGAGQGNQSNGNGSAIMGGQYGIARSIEGLHVFPSSGPLGTTRGVSQAGLLVLAKQTTDATPTVLTSSGAATSSNQVTLPNNSAYYFKGSVIANVTGAANGAAWSFEGAIMRGGNAASTVLIDTPSINRVAASAGATTWTIALTTDTTSGGLRITVTGVAATTIRWVAKCETTEVTF